MIDLSQPLDIEMQPDETPACFRVRTYDGQVMEYLWKGVMLLKSNPLTYV